MNDSTRPQDRPTRRRYRPSAQALEAALSRAGEPQGPNRTWLAETLAQCPPKDYGVLVLRFSELTEDERIRALAHVLMVGTFSDDERAA